MSHDKIPENEALRRRKAELRAEAKPRGLTATEREKEALKAVDRLINEGLGPRQKLQILVTTCPDFQDRRGRLHKIVRVRWNQPRMLSVQDVFLFGCWVCNSVLCDKDDICWGFDGREEDYRDYCEMHGFPYETKE